jgi:hypothetical protein
LNNDGRDDVVATSLYDNSLSYSLAAGDGSLAPAQPLALTSPTGALVADLNGDGKRDIVGSTDFGTEPALFLGNGDGTFASPQSWGGSGEALAGAGDFNSDGQPDLFAWETAGFLALNVYLNRSTPSFIVSRTGVLSPSATVGTMASGGGVSVTNRGPGFLKPSVSFAGPDASDFSIAEGDCGQRPLLVGATCSVSLSFHPSSPGTKTLEYTVTPLRGSPRTGTITATALASASAGGGGITPVTTPRPPQKRCVVPRLAGLTLSRAKRKLAAAHCRLGRVTRRHGRRLVVIRQKLRPRSRRAAGTRVALVLGPRRR